MFRRIAQTLIGVVGLHGANSKSVDLSNILPHYDFEEPHGFRNITLEDSKYVGTNVPRYYLLFEPTNGKQLASEGKRVPAILSIHGFGGTGKSQAENDGFWKSATELGMIAAYPQGMTVDMREAEDPSGGSSWNGGGCCGVAKEKNSNDTQYFETLIDDLVANHNADPDRIYIHGWSNGAIMVYRLLCELGHKINSAVPYAGGLDNRNMLNLDPKYLDTKHTIEQFGLTYVPLKNTFTKKVWESLPQIYECSANAKNTNLLSIHGSNDKQIFLGGMIVQYPKDKSARDESHTPDLLSNAYIAQLHDPTIRPGHHARLTYQNKVGDDQITCKSYDLGTTSSVNVTYCFGTGGHHYWGSESRRYKKDGIDPSLQPVNQAADVALMTLKYFCEVGGAQCTAPSQGFEKKTRPVRGAPMAQSSARMNLPASPNNVFWIPVMPMMPMSNYPWSQMPVGQHSFGPLQGPMMNNLQFPVSNGEPQDEVLGNAIERALLNLQSSQDEYDDDYQLDLDSAESEEAGDDLYDY